MSFESLSLNQNLIDKLFPFYLRFGLDFKLEDYGHSMDKIHELPLGKGFTELFDIKRPYITNLTIDSLKEMAGQIVILSDKLDLSLMMRGQLELDITNNCVWFFGSPWFNSIDDFVKKNLSINDFAIHDPLFDLLNALKNIEVNNEEIRFLLNKVNYQKEIFKKSEEQYKNIINKATNIFYKTNKMGFFTFVNPEGERLTEFSLDELCLLHFSDLVRPTYRKAVNEFYKNQVESRIASTYYEFPILTKSKREVWVGQSVQLLPLDNNNYEFVSLVIDITKQKKSEFEIKDANDKLTLFQNLINNTEDAIQVSDEEGNIFYLNQKASERLGIQIDTASTHKVKDFEKIFENDEQWNNHVAELKKRKFITIEGINHNLKTGYEFPVEVTVKYVEIDNKGYVIANSREITQRKLIENRIKQQEEKYRNIIANMNIGLVEVNNEGLIEYVNNRFCENSGYNLGELIGKNSEELFETLLNIPQELRQDYRIRTHRGLTQIPVCVKTGDIKWWMVSDTPIYNDKQEQVGTVFISLDITQQKYLEFELEKAKIKAEEGSKAKEAFLANMSHEIRTPLNAVIGFVRELGKNELTERQRKLVQNSSIASKHLLSIINNILDISKIEAGELNLENTPFDLNVLFQNIYSIMVIKTQEKKIYFRTQIEPNVSNVLIGDSLRIQQILINIIGNAIKFTQKGGVEVLCKLKSQKGNKQRLQFVINDTGIGMDASYLANLFNKFSQEDKSTSRKFGGTGLGMAITHELVQLMNGEIEVNSEKNVGTTFYVNLEMPIGNSKELKDTITTIEGVDLSDVRVLLVEDNEMNRLVAQNTLSYYNCKADEVENGFEAIEKLKNNQYDVILMDIQMPELDGISTTKIVREELKINTPIIALTANAFKSEIDKCKSIGMNDYVIKPFDENILISTIAKFANKIIETQNEDKEEVDILEVVESQKENSLYDLSNLVKMSRGNDEFLVKMINLFIQQSYLSIEQLKEALNNSDIERIYAVSHRMKPSIDNMGVESLKQEIRLLESLAKEGSFNMEIVRLINYVEEQSLKVIEQLKLII
ncbi:MAG: PAS domain S-box protein [Cytophagales bacterium]